jgi:hypothetical protein
MSGVAAVRYLLANNANITAQVPATRIFSGDAPLATTRPLILVREIDSNQAMRVIRRNGLSALRVERVEVSVIVNSPYASTPGTGLPTVKALLKLCRAACDGQSGTINGFVVEALTEEGEGPDLSDEELGLCSQSNDFFVHWVET